MWEAVSNELAAGWPSWEQLARASIRIVLAAILGAVLGLQRESWGKPAGLRTHMLVAMGAALFVFAPLESGVSTQEATRLVQGVATGIGFIGAGAILKLTREREVEGLTTAAGIWMTAAFGMAVGFGRLGSAVASCALAWVVLQLLGAAEQRVKRSAEEGTQERDDAPSSRPAA
jgi:putative Mg2+ transporter-C (MgtC) family protein